MADTRISDLPVLTASANPNSDVLEILDFANNTNKQITVNNLTYPQVKNQLVAGSNITIVANDTSRTLTISSTGGGGGASITAGTNPPTAVPTATPALYIQQTNADAYNLWGYVNSTEGWEPIVGGSTGAEFLYQLRDVNVVESSSFTQVGSVRALDNNTIEAVSGTDYSVLVNSRIYPNNTGTGSGVLVLQAINFIFNWNLICDSNPATAGFAANSPIYYKPNVISSNDLLTWDATQSKWVNKQITNTLTSATNSLTSTVNGVASSANIINTNALSLNGSNQLISTVNGVASTPLSLPQTGLTSLTSPNLTIAIGGTLTAPTLDIAQQGALTNQALVWNGTKFAPSYPEVLNTYIPIAGALTLAGQLVISAGSNVFSVSGDVRSTFPNGTRVAFGADRTIYSTTGTTFASGTTNIQFTASVAGGTFPSGTAILIPIQTPYTQITAGTNTSLSVANNILTVSSSSIPTNNYYGYDGAVNYSSLRLIGSTQVSFAGNVDTTNIGTVTVTFNASATDGQRPNITLSNMVGTIFSPNQSFFIFAPDGTWNITYAYLDNTAGQLASNAGVLNTERNNIVAMGTYNNCIITGVETVQQLTNSANGSGINVNLTNGSLSSALVAGTAITLTPSTSSPNLTINAVDPRQIRFNNTVGATNFVNGLRISGDTTNFTSQTIVAGQNTYWDTDTSGNPRINASLTSPGQGWILSLSTGQDITGGVYTMWTSNTAFPVPLKDGTWVTRTGFNGASFGGGTYTFVTNAYRANSLLFYQRYQAWVATFSDALTITNLLAEDELGRISVQTSVPTSNPTQSDATIQGLWNLTNSNAGVDFINSAFYDDASGSYEYQRAVASGTPIIPSLQQVMTAGNTTTLPVVFQDGQATPRQVSFGPPATISNNYSITLPSSQGAVFTGLVNNGSGVLTWGVPQPTTIIEVSFGFYSQVTVRATNLFTNLYSTVWVVVLNATGTGYAVGDTFTPASGSYAVQPVFTVTAVTTTGGGVTAVNISNPGVVIVEASGTLNTTTLTGSGSGCRVILTYMNNVNRLTIRRNDLSLTLNSSSNQAIGGFVAGQSYRIVMTVYMNWAGGTFPTAGSIEQFVSLITVNNVTTLASYGTGVALKLKRVVTDRSNDYIMATAVGYYNATAGASLLYPWIYTDSLGTSTGGITPEGAWYGTIEIMRIL